MRNFISKLNDRNLQRKRESGITSYVLYSILILCIYKLFKHLERVNIEDFVSSQENILFFYCFTFNGLLGLYMIINSSFDVKEKIFSNLKIIKNNNDEFNLYSFLLTILFFAISLLLTLFSLNNFKEPSVFLEAYFWILISLNIIPITMIVSDIFGNDKKHKLETKMKKQNKLINDIFVLVISSFVIFSSIMFAFNSPIENKIEYLKIVILFFSLLVIIDKIITFNNMDNSNIILENFEYEIYLKDYSDEKIREILQKKYIGFIINDWIQLNNKELIEMCQYLDNKIHIANESLNDLKSNLDITNYQFEFNGRKELILNEIKPKIEEQTQEIEKRKGELDIILKDQNKFDDEELSLLLTLKNEYEKRISYLKKNNF